MLQHLLPRILMSIAGDLHRMHRSVPLVVSWECPRCGLAIDARRVDGTLSFGFEITCSPPNSSPFKHVAVLTDGGKLSISCERSRSDARQLPLPSGESDGTSSTPGSSASLSAQPCGCDPGAGWTCEQHRS